MYYQYHYGGFKMTKKNKSTHAWGIAGLILGILSLMLFMAPYIGIFLAIAAVVFYGIQKKHEPTSAATGGLVTGIIGIILNAIMLILVVGMLAFFGAVNFHSQTTVGDVADTQNSVVNQKVGEADTNIEVSPPAISCPTIVKTTTYGFSWGESIQRNRNLYLYADFLKNVKFSDEWELTSMPSSNDFMRDSFVCEKGSKAGESVNKLYCRPTISYEPRLRKNTMDSQGNIINTDYQYLKSFIFDASGKDINNANDLKNLKIEFITCSTSSW